MVAAVLRLAAAVVGRGAVLAGLGARWWRGCASKGGLDLVLSPWGLTRSAGARPEGDVRLQVGDLGEIN